MNRHTHNLVKESHAAHHPDGKHRPDHDHHDHSDGLLGRLKHIFAHSHATHERVDAALETSERGIWALKVSLVGLGLTALLQVIIVMVSGSVALLADTIHNFADAGTSIPLWIAFALIRRGANSRFTYGYGRAEDVAGVIIVLVIFASACVAGYESFMRLVEPEPIQQLGWVAVAAVIGFIGNEAVAVFRIRVGREIGSAALVADGLHSRVDGFTSLAVLGSVIGVALGAPILDPLIGLGITVAILFIVKDAATSVLRRLMDGIEPEILEAATHAPQHVDGIQGVAEVRARWVGHRVNVEMDVSARPELSVQDAFDLSRRVEDVLAEHVPAFGRAHVRVRPGTPPLASPEASVEFGMTPPNRKAPSETPS